MKTLLLLLLAVVPFAGQGQQYLIDPDTKKLTYSNVVELEQVDKEELFSRIRKWGHQHYYYVPEVTLTEVPDDGKIFIKSSFALSTLFAEGVVAYRLTLAVKDGKYRYILSDFTFQESEGPALAFEDPVVGSRIRIWAYTDEQVQKLITDLNQAMMRKTFVSVDDW